MVQLDKKRTFQSPLNLKRQKGQVLRFGNVECFVTKDGEIVLRPMETLSRESRLASEKKIKSLGPTEKDIEEAIKWK